MNKRDYYEVLGIGKNASADEIKKAYRKAAVKHHPDKQGGDEAKFKEINEAYEVLKDSAKRQRYDQFGHAGIGGNGGAGNPFEGFGGFNSQNINFDFGDGSLGDIFGQFFGGGAKQRAPERGRDVETMTILEFHEAVFGCEKTINLTMESECNHCKGKTAEPGYDIRTCQTCKGSGQVSSVVNTMFGQIRQQTSCNNCKGRGKVPEKLCSVCGGKGTERRLQSVKIKIPAGVDDGITIRLSGKGEAVGAGGRGDLYVNIRVKADKHFTREGDLILSEERIAMVDAALGTEIDVKTVDGVVRMKVPAGTQSGTDFKLSGHGAPNISNNKRGPHIVSIIVETPTKLTSKQRTLLEEFKNNKKRGFFG